MKAMYKISSTEPYKLPNTFSEEFVDFVDKCCRKDPKERWSCEKLLQHDFMKKMKSTSKQDTENFVKNKKSLTMSDMMKNAKK